ncbi:tannase and feruloyl esterase [Sodiomyces alkalinus F11]|uniref:Carboxylic ester hydrolase n=1 Tax=Sodiomyces alkalinus (strain CBS 110278 / VKM F-3762 / F11) TaxID=1314773 RepID=A0A3N2PUZ4_SODAK|nr:tannase and feruloyl esterase [Sodiomyces alkalinus F11]ROT38321.1 tannase and feruloyl esterase [Sodiomyces alkalinus F11]
MTNTNTTKDQSSASCSPDTFSFPAIFGTELISITAQPLQYQEGSSSAFFPEGGLVQPEALDSVCNLTLTYTHPGQNDAVNTQVLLPGTPTWNHRLLTVGGGGYAVGYPDGDVMIAFASRGYTTATTDGGHAMNLFQAHPAEWALVSPGNHDQAQLLNWAYRAPIEAAKFGKLAAESYYGTRPKRTYWSGCSTGGRQGIAMAQKAPQEFDGILASCPATNVDRLVLSMYWPQQVMKNKDAYPPACELDGIQDAALAACDGLDGIEDGIIALPDHCDFHPSEVVGREVNCGDGTTRIISRDAADIVEAAWRGVVDDETGELRAEGMPVGARLTSFFSTARTTCDEESGECKGDPIWLVDPWVRFFLKRDPHFDMSSLTGSDYFALFEETPAEFRGLFGANTHDVPPSLGRFRKSGAKMITWHGVDDQTISVREGRAFYDAVVAWDAARGVDTKDYYRYFEVPGASHCSAPLGKPFPLHALDALVKWVEEGIVPEFLETVRLGVTEEESGPMMPACLYPELPLWEEGRGFICKTYKASGNEDKAQKRDEL